MCHGYVDPQYDWCWNCKTSMEGVTRPQRLVVPITLYRSYSQFGKVMGQYKRNKDERIRDAFSVQVAALAGRFLTHHRDCLKAAAGVEWDAITAVPSTKGDPDAAGPLEMALRRVPTINEEFMRLVRSNGTPIPRDQPNELAFDVAEEANGRRVLLIDDTLTTGGHLQSAASALARGGAIVVACVVVGRVINPDYPPPERKTFWERQKQIPFDFATCCLEETELSELGW